MFARAYAVAAVILGSTTVQAARPVPRPPRVVTVIAHDYAFTIAGGSAAALPAGPTTFRLVNDGKEMHMMGVSRLDSGSIASFAKAIAANAATGMNNSTQKKFKQFVLSRSFDSGFSLELLVKDLSIALQVGRETGTPTPFAGLCRELAASASLMLGSGADHTEFAKISEHLTGDTLGGKGA